MAEDKADKALRKVIINLIPEERHGGPVMEEDLLKIDISDKLEDGKYYCLESIKSVYDTHTNTTVYIPFEKYSEVKKQVETILDATIVNSKQRASVQELLNRAFYSQIEFKAVI